jgi:WD40 repeat protein/serine/threonine protein kinase
MIVGRMVERAHDDLIGRSLGGFVLRERIGQGGFGIVYRATQPALDREAVVKVLHSKLLASEAATERFLREAKLASKLDHPYAAHIYAFGAEPDGELWIAMELVRGTPLDRLLRTGGRVPLERFVPLLDRICEVVHTAHEQGIVHRDLKPANVMVLTRAGRLLPKLLDFGIAKGLTRTSAEAAELAPSTAHAPTPPPASTHAIALSDTVLTSSPTPASLDGGELTQRGAIMGSPAYMAPEQWVDAAQVDGRTDLYALGVLAYECLTGKPPYVATTLTELALAHARHMPASVAPDLPSALDAVFAKVLAKSAEDRYADALVFAAAFRSAAGVASETSRVPAIDPVVRDAALTGAPQPIAETVAALAAARNAHQARDALVLVARAIVRYFGLLALACRSRIVTNEPRAATEAVRALYRRALSDAEWLELARVLTGAWREQAEAYPVPELVAACRDPEVVDALAELISLGDRKAPTETALHELLDGAAERLSKLLARLAFVREYALVVTVGETLAERWMGVHRTLRATVPISAGTLPAGVVALLDGAGVPVLSLSPLFQIAAPAPGAPSDVFMFEGRDARGARLVALPTGFEHHDDTLWSWFRAQLADSLDDTQSATDDDQPPYRGLRAFSSEDGASFFGREKLVDAFLNRLKLQPMLAVVGRSGAGKSSFVHAGVIPALPAGWRAMAMRPGTSPLSVLAARLEHAGCTPLSRETLVRDPDALGELLREDAARRGPFVLVIDQLEEIFTLCQDAAERGTFTRAIANAARADVDPIRVVFTLRDDFLVRTEQLPALRNRIGLHVLTVPVAEDLLRILLEPARRAGYEFEDPALPEEMVAEVADQPGALALISFTASKLWELRDRHFKQLTRAAYRTLGGVAGALARHADITLDAMPLDERARAREAFRYLVTSQSTRAVRTRSDLRELLGGAAKADRVIEQLIAARLLVASENEAGAETIEIVHEALLVAWPRLVDWSREDAEGARFREQLRGAAAQWQERGSPRDLLWRGEALADYLRWRSRDAGALTDQERAFAHASQAEAVRGQRNRRLAQAGVFTALVAIVVGLIVFNTRITRQRRELADNLQRQTEDQGRQLVLAGEPLQGLAYLAMAADLGAHGAAHDFLVAQAVQATDGEIAEVHHENAVSHTDLSADGARLVTASIDHEARIWDAASGALVAHLQHSAPLTAARFSPDGATVLTASEDGTAVVWDAGDGHALHTLRHAGRISCALFSRDGQLVVTAGGDDVVTLWTANDGVARGRLHGNGGGMVTCALSVDAGLVAAADKHGVTWVWNAATSTLVHELHDPQIAAHTLRFSPDGRFLLASPEEGNSAVEWDMTSGAEVHVFVHKDSVRDATFSPDGSLVVTASLDHQAIVWDARTGEQRRVLDHPFGVYLARFSPDGKYVVTSSDSSARLWDVASGRLVARWRGHQDVVRDVAFDRDGRTVATASDDGSAIVWRVAPQQRETWIAAGSSQLGASFSPDSTRLATADVSGWAHVWDTSTGHKLLDVHAYDGPLSSIAYSPDGRTLAISTADGTVGLWDARTGDARPPLAHGATITHEPGHSAGNTLGWSTADGSLVAGSDDGRLRCWDTRSGSLRFELRDPENRPVISAAFAPDGASIVTVGSGAVRTWTPDGRPLASHPDDSAMIARIDPSGTRLLVAQRGQRAEISRPGSSGEPPVYLVGHQGWVNATSWSPDGATVVTASFDGTARLWDATTGDALAVLPLPERMVQFATFAPDGDHVALVGSDDTIMIYQLPRTPPGFSLARVVECRVPFEVRGNHLQARTKDPGACKTAP